MPHLIRQPRKRSLFASAVVIPALALLLAACSGTGSGPYGGAGAGASSAAATSPSAGASSPSSDAGAGSTAGSSEAAGGSGATVSVATSADHGTYLVGPDGMTLYTYDKDTAGTSACSGACATAWPPLTVAAGQQPKAGDGVTGTLGTITRADGSVQVTYDGLPLYGWQGDTQAGDVTGDGVNGFALALAAGPSGSTSGGGAATSPTDDSGYDY